MKRNVILLFLIFMLIFAGCDSKAQATSVTVTSSSVKEAVTVAKPQEAVDAVYAALKSYKAEPIRYIDLDEQLELKASSVSGYYGKISDPSEGLADVAILLPKEQERENVSLALSKYKEKRMTEFENYDILDAYAIAQNAVIYEQGGYVIMLMLSENDAARKIIDEYIPL